MPLIKILVSVSMVVTLSLIAEHVSPRVAGILSGYPLGAALSLFFIGFEAGPGFASDSALYTSIGLVGIQSFIYFYYLASRRLKNRKKWLNIFVSSVAGTAGYTGTIFVCHNLRATVFMSLAIPLASILLFRFLLKDIKDIKIENRLSLNMPLLLGRAIFSGAIIVLITSAARWVGPRWAGLFSAFPITLFPVMVIVHFSYRLEHVHTLIKNVPDGLVSLFVYAMVIHFTYPSLGIYWGTLIAYFFATIYLVLIHTTFRIQKAPVK